MKYVLYGLPCAGKTTLFDGLTTPVMHGSAELNRMTAGKFSDLPDSEKNNLRIRYAQQLKKRKDSFISDGHYSFFDDVVFTEADGDLYDVFIYLYCEPELISERLKLSAKNQHFAKLSAERIRKWQDFEIACLHYECHKRNKDFYIVNSIVSEDLQDFINKIENGFSSYKLAKSIADKITDKYPEPCELHICDGDKTIIRQDSFRVCTNGYITNAFDSNFYTGYQSLQFTNEVFTLKYDTEKLGTIQLNDMIYSRIADKNYVVLSSGIGKLWEQLAVQYGLKNVIADTLISADTKYFVVKLLQKKGYTVIAYGDGKNDLYMLRQSDTGYLYIGSYLSRSLKNADISGIKLLYDKSPCILADTNDEIADEIAICKSDSGINGSRLAEAHFRLGKIIGKAMYNFVPNTDTAVIVLERGGRFFGDGVYTGFGGTFYSYNPKKDRQPAVHNGIAVIVDSVINTGKSILETIAELKQLSPDIKIFIAANVIQEKALELLRDYKIFAVRTSANAFTGSRQAEQKNGKGPDTADRLFNYIN